MIDKIKKKMKKILFKIENKGSIHLVFGGKIDLDSIEDSKLEDKFEHIKPLVTNSDYSICSIMSNDNFDMNKLIDLNLFNMYLSRDTYVNDNKTTEAIIKKINQIKLGFLFFRDDSSRKDIRKKVSFLKQKKCDFIISFYIYDDFDEIILRNLLRKQDFNYVIGISSKNNEYEYQIIKNRRIIKSLGSLSCDNLNEEKHRDSIILNLKLKKYNGKVEIIEESYYPIYNKFDESKQDNILQPVHKDTYKNNDDKYLIDSRSRIAKKFGKIYEESRFLNVAKLLDIVGYEDKKNKYIDILNEPVNRFGVKPRIKGKNIACFIKPYDENLHGSNEKEYYQKIKDKIKQIGVNNYILIFTPKKLEMSDYEIVCPDPQVLYFKLLNYVMKCNNIRVMIGITGSEGKTTTKELIYSVIKQKYETIKSPYNSNAGYTAYIVQNLRANIEAYVQEISGGVIGAAEKNAKALELTCGVVTNIGTAHLNWSKTRKQLLLNKTNIKNGIINNGPLFICIDNDMLVDFNNYDNIVTYSTKNSKADYYVSNIEYFENRSEFIVEYSGLKEKVAINLMGEHNVENALVAFAVGIYNNVPINLIKRGLLEYKTEGIRQNIIKVADNTLYIDCYNTSPLSTKVAINLFDSVYKDLDNRKVMVLSDYPSLTEKNIDEYKDIANAISNSTFDLIILFGKYAKCMQENINDFSKQVVCFEKVKDATEYLKENVQARDIILFKAANKYILERKMIDIVFGISESFYRYESEFKNVTYRDKDIEYIISKDFVFIKNVSKIIDNTFNMNSFIKNKRVRTIMKEAFMDNKELKYFNAYLNLKNIQDRAFKNCINLEKIVLPENFKILYDNIFENCKNLKSIELGKEMLHIGERCFANCVSLEKIYLSSKLRYIAANAFEGCDPNLIIVCEKGSLAQKYANEKNIKTKIIENNLDLTKRYSFKVGEVINLFDNIFDYDLVDKIYSYNTLKGCVLQNGYFLAREEGELILEIKLKNGEIIPLNISIEYISNEESKIPLLVNRYNGLPLNYKVENLVNVSKYRVNEEDELFLEKDAAMAFEQLYVAALKDNVEIKIKSAYRSMKQQQETIDKWIEKIGYEKTQKKCAPVGFSQHHLGKAIDVASNDIEESEKVQKWMVENAYKFGYVLKNLKDKQHITGTIYEPWHFFYTDDLEIAEDMYRNNLSQEEWVMKTFVDKIIE